MSQETREDLFENMKARYSKVIARQDAIKIDVPEIADEEGNAAIWYIKAPAPWTFSVFDGFDRQRERNLYACGMIVTSAHDMFEKPIFYDNDDEQGIEIDLQQRLATAELSRDRLLTGFPDQEPLMDLFLRVADAITKSKGQLPTPEDVKNNSNQETTG